MILTFLTVFLGRIDNCEFDQQQLLLGTGLFAMLVFLLPSFAVYAVILTVIQSFLSAIFASVYFIVEVFEAVPFYHILLAPLDPLALAQGLEFRVPHPFARQQNFTGSDFPIQSQESNVIASPDGDFKSSKKTVSFSDHDRNAQENNTALKKLDIDASYCHPSTSAR
jgi:hypothetical protein